MAPSEDDSTITVLYLNAGWTSWAEHCFHLILPNKLKAKLYFLFCFADTKNDLMHESKHDSDLNSDFWDPSHP